MENKSKPKHKLGLWIAIAIIAVAGFLVVRNQFKSPSRVTEEFLSAIKKGDDGQLKKVYSGSSATFPLTKFKAEAKSDSLTKMMLEMLEDFDYQVKNEKVNGNKASVTVTIKTYAMGDVVSNLISDARDDPTQYIGYSSDDFEKDIYKEFSKLKKENKKSYTKNLVINLTKTNGKWQVNDFNSDDLDVILNAVTGNFNSAIGEANNDY